MSREIRFEITDMDDVRWASRKIRERARRLHGNVSRRVDQELKRRGRRPWSDAEQVEHYDAARKAFEGGSGSLEAMQAAITPAVSAHIAEQERKARARQAAVAAYRREIRRANWIAPLIAIAFVICAWGAGVLAYVIAAALTGNGG